MTHEEAIGFLQESGWLQDHDRQIYEQGKRDGIEERKTGRWVEHDDFDNSWECSSCNEVIDIIEGTPMDNEYRFCPWCGAKMEGAEE